MAKALLEDNRRVMARFRTSLAPALVAVAILALALAAAGGSSPTPVADTPLGWLAGYLRTDTTNPPGREARAAAFLARILHRHGVTTRTYFSSDGRASLFARLEGRRDDEGLLLLHHLDVVPAGEGWSREPFAGEVAEGELWGRGAVDVKSLGIAHLAAFVALAEEEDELERDVVFLAVADEEAGGVRGTAWLLENHPELFDGIGAAFGEGGTARRIQGRLHWWGVETAQKRPLWIRLTAEGRPGHASGLNPGSAVHDLVEGLAGLLEMEPRWRVTEPVRRYLRALAPLHRGDTARRFADPDAWVGPDGPRGPMLPGQANLFLDSVQVTVLEAGERINVIPPRAEARADVRLLPGTDAEEFLARIRRAVGREVDVEVLLTSPSSPPSPTDHRAYRTVVGVLGEEAPVVPAFIAGFTDSRYLRARGIPTYGVTPFALEPTHLQGIHGPDERIPVDELNRGVERMRRIVHRYATAP